MLASWTRSAVDLVTTPSPDPPDDQTAQQTMISSDSDETQPTLKVSTHTPTPTPTPDPPDQTDQTDQSAQPTMMSDSDETQPTLKVSPPPTPTPTPTPSTDPPNPEPNVGHESIPIVIGVSKNRTKRSESNLAMKNVQRFGDSGDFGFYEGELNETGHRHGRGKITYDNGNYYEGDFVNNKFQGEHGIYRWFDGDEQEGSWLEGERHGTSIFRSASDGAVEYAKYVNGKASGEGVWWSADRKTARKLVDGLKSSDISLTMAEKLAKDKFDLPVPEPCTIDPSQFATTVPASPSSKNIGLIGRLFASRRVGSDGTLLFKDYGEWGSYEGDVDDTGNRQGKGKVTYESGNYYEGGFVDDKYQGKHGIYRWFDGDEYEGPWKDGERVGLGIFRHADGTVEYSMYEKGSHVGDGVSWSADRKTAHKMVDGEKKTKISLGMAEKLAKEKFDLAVPEPSTRVPSQSASIPSSSKSIGFLGRLFSNRKIGPDGKLLCKDYGEWGSYEGDADADGKRQGKGKMIYESGNYYEGGFLDDKFHGKNSVYHWTDGDEYLGEWKEGERHGKGSFRNADGSVEYSMYENGQAKGDGVMLTSDRKTAHSSVDGEKKLEMRIVDAESLIKEKYDFLA